MMKITKSVLGLIGNTPLLKLEKVTKGLKANVLVKLEFLNPSGSIKDRAALYMIEQAERKGKLTAGGIIIDSTTGNFGPALAFVGAVKGYNVRLIISSSLPPINIRDRMNIMERYGAEVLEAQMPGKEVMEGVPEEEVALLHWVVCKQQCFELEKIDSRIWWADQLTNHDNVAAHKQTTGKEILAQTDGNVDVWVASVGSGATLFGVAQALREESRDVKVVAVQPADFPVMDWTMRGRWEWWVEKIGFSRPKTILRTMLEAGLPDETMIVSAENAREMANRLCTEEGLYCGMSSGANVLAAIELAKKLDEGQNVVTVLVDRRDRYLGEHPLEHYVV